ncbi:50S ribosomal protein L21 [Candidatus Curtissbacteria bacterium RIFCSPLOWO2_01_FULL_38_11b]|uniref:Large ribosomal subunit protein bL21 n=1 Tax=Candidatus Curtissbacteria bacterium RIFCSPLOWO2_01_FULL_38_11b TaxID=1797725 RepID=A0A1F5GZK8_9BACT|nr:MAG: 50S ribosomal protein L21 [Candidatus Curtissbacteria bacterium RIFCSPLOWO2_01_FULL_38_11b]
MGTWAIIKIGGKQYKVSEGQTVEVDKLKNFGKSDTLEFKDVLLIKDDQGLKIGKPYVEKAKIKAKILMDFKDRKIRVVKFKSKSRYLKVMGHRQQRTKILISNIQN